MDVIPMEKENFFVVKNYQKIRRKRVKIARNLTDRLLGWSFVKSKILRKIINFAIPYFPISFFLNKYHKLLREEI